MNILVTGVGALIGQGIIRSLRDISADLNIIGVDRSADSCGPYICDDFFAKPKCDERSIGYEEFWLSLLADNDVKLVLPGIEEDMLFFHEKRKLFEKWNIAINSEETIKTACDKWSLHKIIQKIGLPTIPTALCSQISDWPVDFEKNRYILKPRSSNGSRGIIFVDDSNSLDEGLSSIANKRDYIIQEIIGKNSAEFTSSAFGFGDGKSLPPITFRRRLSPLGNTANVEVESIKGIDDQIHLISECIKPKGPTNYQFREKDGKHYLMDLNPRFSSTASLKTLFGYNEARMCIQHLCNQESLTMPKVRSGKAWRYYADYVIFE